MASIYDTIGARILDFRVEGEWIELRWHDFRNCFVLVDCGQAVDGERIEDIAVKMGLGAGGIERIASDVGRQLQRVQVKG